MGMDSRYLRPSFLATDGVVVWAVDELQPVAAQVDAATGAVRRLVSWPELPPPLAESWRVLGAGPDLWVQPGPGAPLARIDPQGSVHGGYSAGRWLAAAEQRGAWCIDQYQPQLLVSDPRQEPEPLHGDGVVIVDAHGVGHRIEVDRPVRAVHVTGEADEAVVYLLVDDAPHTVRDLGASTWEVCWRRAWLRVPPGPVPAHLHLAGAEVGAPALPPRRTTGAQHWHSPGDDPAHDGVHAGQRWWLAGWDPGGPDPVNRRLVLTGHHEDDTQPLRIDLGIGQVQAMLGSDTALWLSVRRRAGVGGSRAAAPVELLRLDPSSGTVFTVLAGDLDISDHCWPLGRPPVDAASYAHYQRDRFADLDAAWRDAATGSTAPLAGHTSRWSSHLAGSWPGTQLVLSFDHRRYPGLRLRRRVPLFDELGRPNPPEFADIHLMEDIDTGKLPPAGEAVNGLLDV